MAALASAVCCLAVAVSGMTAARFALQLPSPSGPLPVGTTELTFGTASRGRTLTSGRFEARVWYPGRPSSDRAPYGSGGPDFRRWLYHQLILTHASRGVGVAEAAGRSPVLVYVAGWGGDRTENTVLMEDLASHGFVVAAIGDIGRDGPPSADVRGPADFSSERAYEQTVRRGNAKLGFAAERASAVLDRLESLNAGDGDGLFAHRLDVHRVGILGFSFGGAVALLACRNDSRFKAAMNLDGWLFDAGSGYRGGVPYFLVTDHSRLPGFADVTARDPVHRFTSRFTVADERQQQAVLQHGGYLLRITGAGHLSFTDVPLYAPLHRFGNGHAAAASLASAIRRYTLAFFERVLSGHPSALLVPGERIHPMMTLASWPARVRR